MSEASSWSTLRGHLMNVDPGRVHIQRVEDKMTTGVPDTNVCLLGKEFWLEGKFIRDLPKRDSTPVKIGLRADQATWLETRHRAGGQCFVWIRVRDVGWMLFEDRFRSLQDGIMLGDFMQEPVYSSAKEMVGEIVRRLR